MRKIVSLFTIILLMLLLTGCSNFKGGLYWMDVPDSTSRDVRYSLYHRVDWKMDFKDGKVSMSSFYGKTLTCDYEAKEKIIYVKLSNGTYKEYYIIDENTISADKYDKNMIWKKLGQ